MVTTGIAKIILGNRFQSRTPFDAKHGALVTREGDRNSHYLNRSLLPFDVPPNFRPVKLSVKSDYAARAVLCLSRHHLEGVARKVEEMGCEQNIPPKYLVQIMIELKSSKIVKSVRGKEGGYLLARVPAEITLGDVLRSVHGEIFDSPALGDPKCPVELRGAWQKMQRSVNEAADAITFQQLLEAGTEKEKMYYI